MPYLKYKLKISEILSIYICFKYFKLFQLKLISLPQDSAERTHAQKHVTYIL